MKIAYCIRPVNEWHAVALAHANTCQYLFMCATVTHAKRYMISSSYHFSNCEVYLNKKLYLKFYIEMTWHNNLKILLAELNKFASSLDLALETGLC